MALVNIAPPLADDPEEWEIDRGEVAYEAYREAAGGKPLATGAPLPPYEELPRVIRDCWIATAHAVSRRFGAIY